MSDKAFLMLTFIVELAMVALCLNTVVKQNTLIASNTNAAEICVKHTANYELIWNPKTLALTCEKDFDLPK